MRIKEDSYKSWCDILVVQQEYHTRFFWVDLNARDFL
jgi:hypothetical protein